MKSNAAGQLLGYTIQFPRALCHLLKSGPGERVCIEVLGDVVTKTKNNELLAEEDKSSLNNKPITDRSNDLWKTFYNWIVAIKDGDIDVGKTKFILYCNKQGKKSLVDKFSDSTNIQDAAEAIKKAKETLSDITAKHAIWSYYDFSVNKNADLLLQVISQFEVQYGVAAGYDEVDYEIQKKHIPSSQLDFLRDKLGGWLLRVIQEKIVKKEPACITWEAFNKQFLTIFERARQRELVDFTLESLPKDDDIQKEVKIRPRYLRQLDYIGCSDDEIVEAVSDFLRADVNRHMWIENDLINEDDAADFLNKLRGYWDTQKKKIKITQKHLCDEEKGQLLLGECKSRRERIRDMAPPHPTISGTYHALAEEPVIGWHPTWKKLLLDQESE